MKKLTQTEIIILTEAMAKKSFGGQVKSGASKAGEIIRRSYNVIDAVTPELTKGTNRLIERGKKIKRAAMGEKPISKKDNLKFRNQLKREAQDFLKGGKNNPWAKHANGIQANGQTYILKQPQSASDISFRVSNGLYVIPVTSNSGAKHTLFLNPEDYSLVTLR